MLSPSVRMRFDLNSVSIKLCSPALRAENTVADRKHPARPHLLFTMSGFSAMAWLGDVHMDLLQGIPRGGVPDTIQSRLNQIIRAMNPQEPKATEAGEQSTQKWLRSVRLHVQGVQRRAWS